MKISHVIFALLCAVSIAMAVAPTDSNGTKVYEFEILGNAEDTISSSTAYDTLAGQDSVEILTDYRPGPGYQYLLIVGPVTGTAADGSGTDSIAAHVRIDSKNASGTIMQSYICDTLGGTDYTTKAGQYVILPFFERCFGHKYDVNLVSTAKNGSQTILNQVYLGRRRPVDADHAEKVRAR